MYRTLAIIALVILAAILVFSQSARAGVACSYEGEGAPTWTVGSESIWCEDTPALPKSIQYYGEPEYEVAEQHIVAHSAPGVPRIDPVTTRRAPQKTKTYHWRHYWTTPGTCAQTGGLWNPRPNDINTMNIIATGTCYHP